jgi:hypothetical protein
MELTINEIINIIHKERVELEVFQYLSDWMVKDRASWIDETMEQRAVVRAISKIADNPNKKEAIIGIKNLCMDEVEDGND